MEPKGRGRVLRLTATTEFDSVQAILADRMAGGPVSGTSTLDFCVRSALAHLNAKTEEQQRLAKIAREFLLVLDAAESRSDLLRRQTQENTDK